MQSSHLADIQLNLPVFNIFPDPPSQLKKVYDENEFEKMSVRLYIHKYNF